MSVYVVNSGFTADTSMKTMMVKGNAFCDTSAMLKMLRQADELKMLWHYVTNVILLIGTKYVISEIVKRVASVVVL